MCVWASSPALALGDRDPFQSGQPFLVANFAWPPKAHTRSVLALQDVARCVNVSEDDFLRSLSDHVLDQLGQDFKQVAQRTS